jgi:PIN domain nuclease of toxin-antitoxin system
LIVLDTHVLVWWVTGLTTELSRKARDAIDRESVGGEILISTISSWEIAMLVERGRLQLTMDVDRWLDVVAEIEAVRFVPVNNRIAVKSVTLPGEFHKDPADRIIVATARDVAAPLVTADEKILQYAHVATVW